MRKQLISLCLILVLICSFILSFAGCGGAAGENTPSSGTSTDGTETFRLVPVSEEEAIAPNKRSYSDEEQAILDEYYRKMLEEYPSWREIPRRMLQEHYDETDDRVNVSFTFCLGGIGTRCKCRYFSGPNCPEGGWTIEENGFRKFYSSGVSQEQKDALLDRLAAQIDAMIEEEGYVSNESVRDQIYLSWAERDGELFATSEYIVYYANPPKNTDPDEFVSDHEHLFASIKLE